MSIKTFAVKFSGYRRETKISGLPSKSGIYCVYIGTYNPDQGNVRLHRLIYIGQAENLKDRVETHDKWERWRRYVKQGQGLWFSYALVEKPDLDIIEAALINNTNPPVNADYTENFPFPTTSLVLQGDIRFLNQTFTVSSTLPKQIIILTRTSKV